MVRPDADRSAARGPCDNGEGPARKSAPRCLIRPKAAASVGGSGRPAAMAKGGECPPWCAAHVVVQGAGQHRVTLGDVRLTLSVGALHGWQAAFNVRRRAGRTSVETAELTANMS